MTTATKRKSAEEGGEVFDRELVDLPRELRWREWMGRIEAVLFASASPVGRDDLARVVGQGASIEMLIEDIEAELTGRPYELVQAATGWMFRTRVQFAEEISRDLLARLRHKDLIASGPRSPRPGAPHTFVTTETFLATFDLQALRDLPDLEIEDGVLT